MPFLDWVNKTQALNSAAGVPYHQQSSDGRCLFLFAAKIDKQGRDVGQQIDHTISQIRRI